MGLKTKIVDLSTVTEVEKDISAVLFQYPDTNGSIQNFQNLIVPNHWAYVYQIWYVETSNSPLPNFFKLCPWGQI